MANTAQTFKPRQTIFSGPPMVSTPTLAPRATIAVPSSNEDIRTKNPGRLSFNVQNIPSIPAIPFIGPILPVPGKDISPYRFGFGSGSSSVVHVPQLSASTVAPAIFIKSSRQDNRIPIVGYSTIKSALPSSQSTTPAALRFAYFEDRRYPELGRSLSAKIQPASSSSQLVTAFLSSKSEERKPHSGAFVAGLHAPGLADVFVRPLTIRIEEKPPPPGSAVFLKGFNESPAILPGKAALISMERFQVKEQGSSAFQLGTIIFRNTPNFILANSEQRRPHDGSFFSARGGVTSGTLVAPSKTRFFSLESPSSDLIRHARAWFGRGYKGYKATQDPPLVIDTFDISYLITDTFNVGDAGTLTYNQVFFVNDVRRFQTSGFTIDGSPWTVTGATLVLINPAGTSHSYTATAASSTLNYYDTLSNELSSSGLWSCYWVLTDGAITLTMPGQTFFVRDVT